MSFVQTRQTGNRPAILVTVAALHGVAIFALVTGLGVKVVDSVVANLPTHNYPAEQDPPPPPPPETKPEQKPDEQRNVRVPEREIALVPDRPVFEGPDIELPDIPDIPDEIIETPYNPPRVEAFTPVAARPSNNPSSWVTTNDYPTRDLRQGNQGTVRIRLRIGADGRVSGCDVVRSSGYPGLDAATCKNVVRRARFKPATDETGTRVASSDFRTITWVIPD